MSNELAVISGEYDSSAINDFSHNAKVQKCTFYASDVLNSSGRDAENLESVIQHTINVFSTLELNADEHFYCVFRCDPHNSNNLYRDWKLSELACIYLSLSGDPTDLKAIARQQTDLIDVMLDFMHDQQYQMMNQA